MKEDLLPTGNDRPGQPGKKGDRSWNEDLLNVDHQMHDNWVEYFKT